MTDVFPRALGVVPVLIGPLQVFLAMLPAILVAIVSTVISLLRPSAVKSMLKLLWRLKVQVLVIVVALVGLWWGLGALLPAATTHRVADAPAEAGRDWPLFRGDLARTGAAPDSPDPTGGGVRWRYIEGDEAYLSSPAVVGNRVYFTTAEMRVGRGRGEIVCLDASDGRLLWKTRPERYDATFSSPVISGEYLVVGEGLHTTTDARVICLSLAPGREGEILWSYQTRSHVESTPAIYNGKVYVGAGDKEGYYCFALEGDGAGNPKVLWHRWGEQYPDAETSIAAANGRFYAGLGNDGQALVELDAGTGEELRRIDMPYPVFSPPAIVDGKLYVGCGNGNFAKHASQLGLPTAGQLVRVDLETFSIDWSYDLPDTVLGSPAVKDGKLYAGCRNGELFVLTVGGDLIRTHATGAQIMTSPALGERTVYVISTSGVLQAFDTRTGRAVWERMVGNAPTGSDFGYISSPAIARGRLYLGTQHDGFLCVGEPGEPRKPTWSGARGGTLQGAADGVPLPEAGSFLGQYPPSRQGERETAALKSPPALMGKYILTPLADLADAGLACLTVGPGGFEEVWRYDAPLGVHLAPAAIGTPEGGLDRTLLVTGEPGDEGRKLACLDSAGQALWTRPVHPDAAGALHATADAVYAQVDRPGTLTRLSLDGRKRWTARTGPLAAPPRMLGQMIVCGVGGERPGVVILDAPTGRAVLRKPLEVTALRDVVVREGTVLALTDRGVLAIDPAEPERRPRSMGPPAASAGTLAAGSLWYVSGDGKLVTLEAATGALRTGPEASPLPPLFVGRTLLFVDAAGEIRVRRADAEQRPGGAATFVPDGTLWLGKPATAPVSAGGRVYVGIPGWGLCALGGAS